METAKNEGCRIIACSALLTTTMGTMAEVVKQAEAAGIRTSSYCDIENGRKGTKPATAKKIAQVLDFPWTDFYEDEEET